MKRALILAVILICVTVSGCAANRGKDTAKATVSEAFSAVSGDDFSPHEESGLAASLRDTLTEYRTQEGRYEGTYKLTDAQAVEQDAQERADGWRSILKNGLDHYITLREDGSGAQFTADASVELTWGDGWIDRGDGADTIEVDGNTLKLFENGVVQIFTRVPAAEMDTVPSHPRSGVYTLTEVTGSAEKSMLARMAQLLGDDCTLTLYKDGTAVMTASDGTETEGRWIADRLYLGDSAVIITAEGEEISMPGSEGSTVHFTRTGDAPEKN